MIGAVGQGIGTTLDYTLEPIKQVTLFLCRACCIGEAHTEEDLVPRPDTNACTQTSQYDVVYCAVNEEAPSTSGTDVTFASPQRGWLSPTRRQKNVGFKNNDGGENGDDDEEVPEDHEKERLIVVLSKSESGGTDTVLLKDNGEKIDYVDV